MLQSKSALITGLLVLVGTSHLVAKNQATPLANQVAKAPEKDRKDALNTVIFVEDMHCKHCAKRLARKLFTVAGVKKVKANIEQDFAVVIPETKKTLSPLALWEAAEAAKFKVVRIETPTQTFKTKPVDLAEQNNNFRDRSTTAAKKYLLTSASPK